MNQNETDRLPWTDGWMRKNEFIPSKFSREERREKRGHEEGEREKKTEGRRK